MRILLIFCTIFLGCNTLNQPKAYTAKQACIVNLKNNLKGNWSLSDDSVFYQTSYKFLTELDTVYDQCLNMLDQSEIIELFGNPTETHKMKEGFQIQSSFDYLVSLPCKKDAENSWCNFFVFYFDSDLKVVRSEMISHVGLTSY